MSKIEKEQRVVEQMIHLYCRKHEHNKELCTECKELLEYATTRLQHCEFGNEKGTCKTCPIHCYRPDMKERIRVVMRWAGPRMMLYHPITAVQHLWSEARKHHKNNNRKR